MVDKHLPAKRNPLLQRATPLGFDNVTQEDLLVLTDDQKADRFLSRWMELVDPFITYKKVFPRGDSDQKRILKEIKNFYKRFVLKEAWTEQKYFTVVNAMLEARAQVGPLTIERFGKLYDNEGLPEQIKARRAGRK